MVYESYADLIFKPQKLKTHCLFFIWTWLQFFFYRFSIRAVTRQHFIVRRTSGWGHESVSKASTVPRGTVAFMIVKLFEKFETSRTLPKVGRWAKLSSQTSSIRPLCRSRGYRDQVKVAESTRKTIWKEDRTPITMSNKVGPARRTHVILTMTLSGGSNSFRFSSLLLFQHARLILTTKQHLFSSRSHIV